ncbi:ATM interactor isoform X2 [Parasteatoda tepidariorum]|uniref:ATM interactor isoform X2 n=1 Tax=Parasteatoda tepidariorum TaxID=114398 RepID=UPI001C724C59|nr:ATM interactor isoform X2 [Parasteatoda tepidariorum]
MSFKHINYVCPERNLKMPLERVKPKKMKGEYHCPFSGCLYNGSEKSFSGKKFLNQHIAKVHAEKKFICEKCGKGFGLDWWRKHHEKTCGMEWLCDCGSKYTSRESLLTHARRSGHNLPDHIVPINKSKQTKPFNESMENPVILLFQPVAIAQGIKCERSALHPRPIFPKVSESRFFTTSTVENHMHNEENVSYFPPCTKYESTLLPSEISISNDTDLNSQKCSSHIINLQPVNTVSSTMKAVATQTFSETELPSDTGESNVRQMQVSIATQTCNEMECLSKTLESRASQCSRRKSKTSSAVRNESTHTQTAESAVVKIKRKRSRRKSVAITTEPCLFTENQGAGQSVWPNFKDLILQNPETSLFRNTMSTQTNYYASKVLCDSQTITDKELFDWAETIKKDYESDICKQPFELSNQVPADPLSSLQQCKQPFIINNDMPQDSLVALQDSNFCVPLPEFDLFSTDTITKDDKLTKMRNNFTHMSSESTLENKNCPIFDIFSNCTKPVATDHPVLSDIHTQTISNTELDFSLLANMETQTTDDFALYDLLEFSDTETQTPWDDFPDLDKSPPDQYSIEIQTDFSLADAELNPDPYAFFNDNYVQNMIDACAEKERLSVNIETQTHDLFPFPQFTNSESQTLDISDLI